MENNNPNAIGVKLTNRQRIDADFRKYDPKKHIIHKSRFVNPKSRLKRDDSLTKLQPKTDK